MNATQRAIKPTKAVMAQRVKEIYAIRLDGAGQLDVMEFIHKREKEPGSPWFLQPGQNPLSDGVAGTYIRRADNWLQADIEKDREKQYIKHLALRRHIYHRCMQAGDTKTALAVLADEAKLLGLYAATKIVGAGITVSEMEREEILAMLGLIDSRNPSPLQESLALEYMEPQDDIDIGEAIDQLAQLSATPVENG